MSLEGQVALITGATSGIGLATARAMTAAGMKLAIAGRRAERLRANAEDLGECISLPGEITDDGAPEALFQQTLDHYGRLDVVFSNAGLIANGPAEDIDLDDVSRMVRVNVEAMFRGWGPEDSDAVSKIQEEKAGVQLRLPEG